MRQQLPLHVSEISEPEPDVAVVKGAIRDYVGTGHPTTALLVVEVSDATLRYERGDKANFYAAHDITDHWVVNLLDLRLEVRRQPVADAAQCFGFRFEDIAYYNHTQSVMPLASPAAAIAVADLLP